MFWVPKRQFEQFRKNMRGSFSKLKEDMGVLSAWVSYLNEQNQYLQGLQKEQADQLKSMHQQLAQMPHLQRTVREFSSEMHGLQREVKSMKQLVEIAENRSNGTEQELAELKATILELRSTPNKQEHHFHAKQTELLNEINALRAKISTLEEKKPQKTDIMREAVKNHVIRKIRHHSKEYVKNTMLQELSAHPQLPALSLRDVIVSEKKLTSKSSFYRLLEELQQEQKIDMINKGKEKIILPLLKRQNH